MRKCFRSKKLNDVQQIEDEQNHENRAKSSCGTITPIPAVGPGGDCPEQHEYKQNNKYSEHKSIFTPKSLLLHEPVVVFFVKLHFEVCSLLAASTLISGSLTVSVKEFISSETSGCS